MTVRRRSRRAHRPMLRTSHKKSLRVLQSLRNVPNKHDVIVALFCLWTARIIMHRSDPSTTHTTPVA